MICFSEKNKIIQKYKILNKKIFPIKKNKENGIILAEFNAFQSLHISISYLSNFLAEKFNAKIVGYFNYCLVSSPLNQSILTKLKWFLGTNLKLKIFSIYNSFGVKKFIHPKISPINNKIANKEFKKLKEELKTKDDIINLKISGIEVGTLIYDGFKIYHKVPYIDLEDKKFWIFLSDFINLFFFWLKYIEENNIKCVVGAHSVYAYGIPLRIAAYRKIPAFAIEDEYIHRLDLKNKFQHGEYKYFKKIFSSFTEIEKSKAKTISEKILNRRFLGMTGVHINDSRITTSSFANKFDINKRILNDNNKIKVIIFTHEINDASNALGKNFYPDYFEWLKAIIELSKQTDFDWYIKDHPKYGGKFTPGQVMTEKITKDLIKNNSLIKFLPSSTSHHQIIKEGINFALTVNGDISYEYAYFNVPVLTATKNCTTINYDFNIHSQNVEDYEYKIKNLDKINFKINREEILEYYFMMSVYKNSGEFMNFADFLKENDNWESLFSEKIYGFFLKRWSEKFHQNTFKTLENFYNSNDHFLDYRHSKISLKELIQNNY